jgi:Uma2 family endonuclease
MSTQPKTFVTPEEYLELERKAEHKSEYYNGEIFAMSGVTLRHDAIAVQLLLLIGQHLRGKHCRWHTSDMRVLVAPTGLNTYPDLSATCEEPRYSDSNSTLCSTRR